VATILMIFLRINLSNFVQFKQYYGKSEPHVLLFKARFFSNRYCEYKRFKHW